MMNLVSVLEENVKEHPEKTAVVFGEQRFSFGLVNAMANRVANGLKSNGISKGDKVALSCPNLPYFPIIYYGILKAGGVVVPINILLKGREIAYHLKDSDARAYFCFQGTPDLPMAQEGFKGFSEAVSCEYMFMITADPHETSPVPTVPTLYQLMADQPSEFDTTPTGPNDTAVILYTSGTTGYPKGAELSHMGMTMNAFVSRDIMRYTGDDILVVVLPLFHSFGQTCQMNAGFLAGCTLVLIPRFTVEAVLEAIQKEKASIFSGVPTMYWALLNADNSNHRFDFNAISKTLRVGVSGGASLPLEVIRGIEEKYGILILEGYGLSETCPVASFNHLWKERKPGSVGTPIWGVDIKILDGSRRELPVGEIGEVCIRGHNVMKGYYKKPEATAEAFRGTDWFHTGDLGRKDEDGYLYIVDRAKDLIIRGGYNVYPREIEEVLMMHEDISMAAVIGVPHNSLGEEVKAYIIPRAGSKISEAEIVAWAKENMAAYKYPRIYEIRDTLPMTATGKILKGKLR